jgi:hypothetical protein
VLGTVKLVQLRRASWTIGRYLACLSLLLGVLLFSRVKTAFESWGVTTYRSPPCTPGDSSYVYTTQLSTLVFLAVFAAIGAPQVSQMLQLVFVCCVVGP